jgi:hypothetical protein
MFYIFGGDGKLQVWDLLNKKSVLDSEQHIFPGSIKGNMNVSHVMHICLINIGYTIIILLMHNIHVQLAHGYYTSTILLYNIIKSLYYLKFIRV